MHPRLLKKWAAVATGLGLLAGGGFLAQLARGGEWFTRKGDGGLTFPEPSGATSAPMAVYYHRPDGWRAEDGKVLVLIHGADRDARAMRDAWRQASEAHGLLVIAPEFNDRKYPDTRWFNLGNTIDRAGRPVPQDRWSFGAVERAVAAVRAETGAAGGPYMIYGFSAGSQFTMRLLYLTGARNVSRAILSSAGWYTIPDLAKPWPCGLAGADVTPDKLRSFLKLNVTLQLGELDSKASDYFGAEGFEDCAAAQGAHRLARGLNFLEAARKAAGDLQVATPWTVAVAPKTGHSVEGMAAHASSVILRRADAASTGRVAAH
ncbi:hypothetical protein ABEG18_06600 [Alsobacter sp. KACC 23698]|uniref:Alpha/beta hydrolase n=1 Tax=Alsobacter sp. KACC 23698 TaxID=3149229 RepID=A0AAU7JJ70_9HYPH